MPVKARMRALRIVKVQIPADGGARVADAFIGSQINLLVFDAAPEPLDEHIFAPGGLAVHADRDFVFYQHASKSLAGELASLIRVEDLRLAVFRQSLLQRLDAKIS